MTKFVEYLDAIGRLAKVFFDGFGVIEAVVVLVVVLGILALLDSAILTSLVEAFRGIAPSLRGG